MVAQKWLNGSRFLKASLCIYARTFSAFNVRRREKKEGKESERTVLMACALNEGIWTADGRPHTQTFFLSPRPSIQERREN